ncbi:Protocadherin beta-7 [Halotydeus destructor]|nr:Protocadherin beta-7 [Halotydeus destructor]
MLLRVALVLLLTGCPRASLGLAYATGNPATGSASFSSANLCFLSHGGSSETFTVNEASAVNFVIGALKVIGNVATSDRTLGDIELSLAPDHPKTRLEGQQVPIRIEEHSKNLILTRTLDKEGPEGEQGIVVGVRCRKVYQPNEPPIIIPVRIIVTDANDHAPEFVGAPYVANVSEVTIVGSLLLPPDTIRAQDADQQGPFSTVEYYVEPGPFSHMAKFETPFGGHLVLTAPLDYETLPKFWINIKAQDQGEPPNVATTTVTINVLDADDQNPHFQDDKYTATIPDNNRPGEQLVVSPKPIRATDPDTGISSPIEFSFSSRTPDSREYGFFHIDPKFGYVTLKKPLPPSIDLPLTLVIRATQVDNRDRYALATLTVFNKRKLVPEASVRFLQASYNGTLLENIPTGHVALTVQSTRSGGDKNAALAENGLQYKLLDDDSDYFSIKANGEIIVEKPLDFESKPWYSFRVMVTDGKHSNVTKVNISLLNVNDHDPEFGQLHYTFFVSESRLNSDSVIGDIKATDADGDRVAFAIRGPFAKVFSIDDDGSLKVKSIKSINNTQCHLIVVATDSGSPPRSSSAPVTVQFAPGIIKSFGRSLDELEQFMAKGEISNGQGTGMAADVDVNMLLSASSSSAIVLVIVLGVLLATLFIIIITLTVHVLKQRKFTGPAVVSASSSSSSSDGSASPNHYQSYHQYQGNSRRSSTISSLASKAAASRLGPLVDTTASTANLAFNPAIVPGLGSRGVENPIFNLGSAGAGSNLSSRYYSTPTGNATTGSAPSGGFRVGSEPDSAIVSDASSSDNNGKNGGNSSGSSEDGTEPGRPGSRHSSRGDSGSPPPPPPSVTCGQGHRTSGLGLKWPQGSIPRRVKKLTWEDEIGGYRNNFLCQSVSQAGDTGPPGANVMVGNLVAIKTGLGTTTGASLTTSGMPSVGSSSPILRHTELDPDVSVAPLRRTLNSQNSSSSGLPDLTVYF